MSSKSLRSLMKDRQLARRIQHQFAKYDSFGRLTCSICNGLTVKSESLWPSHLNSKTHRVNYQRDQANLKVKSELNISTNSKISTPLKRKSDDDSVQKTDQESSLEEKKLRFTEPPSLNENETLIETDNNEREGSKMKHLKQNQSTSLPDNFFDDPSEAPNFEESRNQTLKDDELSQDDEEWREFQAALDQPKTQEEDTPANVFANASLIAEPVLYQPNQQNAEGLMNNANPDSIPNPQVELGQEDGKEEEDPIEKKIREEKEEIMDRIQNEEREQLEADQRVIRMKARVEAFRAKRKNVSQK